MAFGRASEDRPTPAAVYNWRIYTLAICVCTGPMMMGYNIGVIGGNITLPSFHEQFNLPDKETKAYSDITSNIVSATSAGCFFGALGTFPIVERWGRKLSLALGSLFYLLGGALMTFSHGSLPLVYAGRSISGIGIGASSLIVPIYLSEISPPSIRGFITGFSEIFTQTSALLGFWSNYITSKTIADTSARQWMIPLGVQMIPGGLLFIFAVFLLPESPRYLVKKHQSEKALQTLCWLRNLRADDEYVVEELRKMQAQADREVVQSPSKGRMFRELLWIGNRNRVALGMMLMLAQNLTGINALNFYSVSIFNSIGFTGTSVTLFATGMWGLVKSGSTIMSMFFFIDRLGRRKLLLIGAVSMACTMWYIGGFLVASGVTADNPGDRSPAAWVAIVCLYLFAVAFCIGWNSVPWIFCSEIFPNRLRNLCVSLTTSTQWAMQFATVRGVPYMIAQWNGGTYMFFGAWLVVIAGWVYFCIPETKGLALEDMDRIFGVPGNDLRDVGHEFGQLPVDTVSRPKGKEAEEKVEPLKSEEVREEQ